MKVLKLFFAAFILLFAFTSVSMAQNDDNSKPMRLKKTPEQYAEKKAKKMQEKLGLSSDQYNQIYNLFYQSALDRQTRMNSDDKPSKEQRKQYMMDMNTKIESILTAEQLDQWKKYKEERKGKHKEKGKKKEKRKNKTQGEMMELKKEPRPER